MAAEKRCSKCKEVKSVDKFHKKNTASDGRKSQCKECRKEYSQSDAYKESVRRYQKSDKGRRSRKANRQTGKNKEADKKYEQRDYVRARRRLYSKSEAGKASVKRYRQSEKGKKTVGDYEKYGKGKLIKNRNSVIRRTRKSQAGGSYTDAEWYKLCEFYDFCCLKCLVRFPFDKLTVDHIKPVAKGGCSFVWNLQPLCGRCNREKAASEIDYRKTVPDWIDRDSPVWMQDKLF